MRKIVSIIAIVCLLVNNVSFAIDIKSQNLPRGNVNLSPPLMLDDMIDNSLALAIMWLKANLEELDSITEIDNKTNLKVIKEAIKKKRRFRTQTSGDASTHPKAPKITIKSYFNNLQQLKKLSDHIFSVPVSVERGGKRKDYRLLFSTLRENENVPFPVFFCTEKDLKKLKRAIKDKDVLPKREKTKDRAIQRYIQQEEYDRIIELAHQRGIAIPSGDLGIHLDGIVGKIRQIALIGFSRESTDGRWDALTYPGERECYIIPLGAKIRKNATIQTRLEKNKVTVVAKDGTTKEIIALCHTSNNAIHIFLDNTEIDYLRRNAPEGADLVREKIEADIAHEIGVMCGFPVLRFEPYPINVDSPIYKLDARIREYSRRNLLAPTLIRPVNKLDLRYAEGLKRLKGEGRTFVRGVGYYGTLDIRQIHGYEAYKLQDLDTNLESRDYAMGAVTNEPHTPELSLGSLGSEGFEYKLLALIKKHVRGDLEELNKLSIKKQSLKTIRQAFKDNSRLQMTQTYFEDTGFEPAEIQVEFDNIDIVAEDIFSIPIIAWKGEIEVSFRLLFSSIRENGSYPTVICAEREFNKLKSSIVKHGKLPKRKAAIEKALDRYIGNNEEIIDPWIREHMRDPENFIEIRHGESIEIVERFLDLIYEVSDPEKYPNLRELNRRLRGMLGGIISKLIEERKIVLIRVKDDEDRPVIIENGKQIEVGSHSSQYATYIFINETSKTPAKLKLFDMIKSYLETGPVVDRDHAELDDLTSLADASSIADLEIVPKLLHEIGVLCGLKYQVTNDKRIINNMDRLYDEAQRVVKGTSGKIPEQLIESLNKNLELTNLNANLLRRDYAAMSSYFDYVLESLPNEKVKTVAMFEKGLRDTIEEKFTVDRGKPFRFLRKLRRLGEREIEDIYHIEFNNAEKFKKGIFVVPCKKYKDASGNIDLQNYNAIINFYNNRLNILVVTKKELEALKRLSPDEIVKTLRSPKDRDAIERYIEHEKAIDDVIEFAHNKGLAKKPFGTIFNYKKTVGRMFDELKIDVETPKHLTKIENRDFFLVKMTPQIESMMSTITIPGTNVKILYNKHSSNRAIHIFVKPEYYNALTSYDDKFIRFRSEAIKHVESELSYEIGAIFAFQPWFGVDDKLQNEISRRYERRRHDTFKVLKAKVCDLDMALRAPRTLVEQAGRVKAKKYGDNKNIKIEFPFIGKTFPKEAVFSLDDRLEHIDDAFIIVLHWYDIGIHYSSGDVISFYDGENNVDDRHFITSIKLPLGGEVTEELLDHIATELNKIVHVIAMSRDYTGGVRELTEDDGDLERTWNVIKEAPAVRKALGIKLDGDFTSTIFYNGFLEYVNSPSAAWIPSSTSRLNNLKKLCALGYLNKKKKIGYTFYFSLTDVAKKLFGGSTISATLNQIDEIPIIATEREDEIREKLKEALIELKEILKKHTHVLERPLNIGAFCETKGGEGRAGIVPDIVTISNLLGIECGIQRNTGVTGENRGSRFEDTQYRASHIASGARLFNTAQEVFEFADIIQHIKELQKNPDEEALAKMAVDKKGRQIIFNFNHFAQDIDRLKRALKTGATFVSFENVIADGKKSILKGPSEKAGVIAAYKMALYLLTWKKDKKEAEEIQKKIQAAIDRYDKTNIAPVPDIDLSGYKVPVYGGGVVGYNQARMLAKMGATVIVIEKDEGRIEWLNEQFEKEKLKVTTIKHIDRAEKGRGEILQVLKVDDGISTTAYVLGRHAQPLINKEELKYIGGGKVFTVVDIDQGGGAEGVHDTSHEEPVYEEGGNLYYCVPNIPALVPRQTSIDISLAAFKYLAVMAMYGLEKAVEIYPELAYAVDVSEGRITNPIIQDEFPDIDESMKMETEIDKMTSLELSLNTARSVHEEDMAQPHDKFGKFHPLPGRSPQDAWKVILEEAIKAIPNKFSDNGMDRDGFAGALTEVGCVLSKGLREKSAIIFSQKLTFDHGLGILLAKLAKANVNVACIATTEKQKEIIRELNEKMKLRKDEEIVPIERIAKVQSAMTAKGRTITHSYYFRDKSEKDPGKINHITNVIVTAKQIIQALRKASNTTSEALSEHFERAIRLFQQAA